MSDGGAWTTQIGPDDPRARDRDRAAKSSRERTGATTPVRPRAWRGPSGAGCARRRDRRGSPCGDGSRGGGHAAASWAGRCASLGSSSTATAGAAGSRPGGTAARWLFAWRWARRRAGPTRHATEGSQVGPTGRCEGPIRVGDIRHIGPLARSSPQALHPAFRLLLRCETTAGTAPPGSAWHCNPLEYRTPPGTPGRRLFLFHIMWTELWILGIGQREAVRP